MWRRMMCKKIRGHLSKRVSISALRLSLLSPYGGSDGYATEPRNGLLFVVRKIALHTRFALVCWMEHTNVRDFSSN